MDPVTSLLLDEGSEGGRSVLLPGEALRLSPSDPPVLVGGLCRSCGERMFPRPPVCPACMSEDIAAEDMPRHGTVYALSTVHVGPAKWAKPFTVGYVDLANGVRVFTRLTGPAAIDRTVRLGVAEVGRDPDGTPISSFVFEAEA